MKKILIITILIIASLGNINAKELYFNYNYSYFAPIGFSVGYVPNKIGGYVSGKFGISSGGSGTEYYSMDEIVGVDNYNKLGTKRSSYSGGIIIKLINKLALYGGAGYGSYGEAYGSSETSSDSGVLIIKDQFAGPEAEVGFMYVGDSYTFGIGGIYMVGTNVDRKAQLYDISIQVGLRF